MMFGNLAAGVAKHFEKKKKKKILDFFSAEKFGNLLETTTRVKKVTVISNI